MIIKKKVSFCYFLLTKITDITIQMDPRINIEVMSSPGTNHTENKIAKTGLDKVKIPAIDISVSFIPLAKE